jgi:two-component system, cell cycle sensor histidine kinase and response regulator CckA
VTDSRTARADSATHGGVEPALDVAHDALGVLERISDAYIVLDSEYRFVYANPAAERDMQHTLAELRGRVHWEVFPASRDILAGRSYRAVVETKVPQFFSQHYCYEGFDIHMEMQAYPTDTGGVAVFWRDVTARVKAEEALRAREAQLAASEARLRAVIEEVPVGVFVADGDGRLAIVNRQAEEMFGGAPPADGIADYSQYRGVWTETGVTLAAEDWALARALTTGERAYGERVEIERFDGGRRSVLNHAAPIIDSTGRRIGGVAACVDVTAQVNAETARAAALQAQADWFRAAFEEAPISVAVLRGRSVHDCLFEVANGSFRLLHDAQAHVVGCRLAEVIPNEESPIRQLVVESSVTQRASRRDAVPVLVVSTDGGPHEQRYFNLSVHPLRDAQSAVAGFVVVGSDVTDTVAARHHAETLTRELRASEARARIAFLESPLPMWVFDLASLRILDANDAAVRQYGYSREELTSFTLRDLRPDEEQERLDELLKSGPHGVGSPATARHRTKDGRILDVEVTAQNTVFDGRPARITAVVDISERARSAEALRASEERYALAARATRNAIWDWDLISSRISWNEGLYTQFAYSPEMVKEHMDWWTEAMHPDDRDRVYASLMTVLDQPAGGEQWEATYRFRRGDGHYVQVFDQGYVARDPSGKAVRMIGAIEDVTEKHRLEEQLRRAQKMEAVGQLAGGIAHDFNNLLTVINGNLEFVRTDLGDAHPARTDLEEIAAAAERASSLVRQLLAFSRKQPVQPRLLPVGSLLHSMERLLRRLIGEEIAFQVQVDADTPMLHMDPGQFEQVVMNLVVNARDAMQTETSGQASRGGTLLIEASGVEAATLEEMNLATSGEHVLQLVVRDTGHGMDEETRARIFEPFFTTKALGVGTGLGLATVHGIVSQAGGTIAVDSEPGRGTTFTVRLPASAAADEAPPPIPQAGVQRPTGACVLLVEDEAPLRAVLRRALERGGHRVHEARHGADAYSLWQRHRGTVDIIVTDVRMPELSGPELAARVRAEDAKVPVLYLSGYADQFIVEQLGPRERFLGKPFTFEEFYYTLGELLPGTPVRSSSSRTLAP